MPRTKEYDPVEVLDRAKNVFWRQGYHATSMEDLVEGMGISRYGIYTTFTSKHDLFLSVLERYLSTEVSYALAGLEAPDASLPTILAFFDRLREYKDQACSKWGCLMCNSASEMAAHDADVASIIDRFVSRYTAAFERPLQRAQEKGEVAPTLDIQSTSAFLVGIVMGFSVYSRATTQQSAVDTFLSEALRHILPEKG